MVDKSEFRPNLDIFGVPRLDSGWLYIFKNANRFKIGKSNNPERRLKDARTWLPDIEIIGIKPFWNISRLEKKLHVGLARYWVDREWYCIPNEDPFIAFLDQFKEFYDDDRDMNSVDFIYWYNGSGMAELEIEQHHQGLSKSKFLKQEASRGSSPTDKNSGD